MNELITRLNEDGSITREWTLGHNNPFAAKHVVVTRSKVYPCVSRRGPAWTWLYSYRADDGLLREHGRSLVEIRRFVRRNFPAATVTEAWAS